MRKRFEQQKSLDATPISEVQLSSRSRDAFPKLLAALQYIFTTPELNEAIFEVLEAQVLSGKQQTGRLGMSLWEILVLGTVRLCMDMDYDRLQDEANHHSALRGILGIRTQQVFGTEKGYPLQTMKDNVSLLTEETLVKINVLVVKAGHQLKKKSEGVVAEAAIPLQLSSDTYVAEATIAFPTDLRLLWCSGRKSLAVLDDISSHVVVVGWRKRSYLRRLLKRHYRKCSNIHRKKGNNYLPRLQSAVQAYLQLSQYIADKLKASALVLQESAVKDLKLRPLLEQLMDYNQMLVKHIDLVGRRILQGETIPHSEKVFSIFERHVEWMSKGKEHKRVELGHNVLVTRDQWGFIIDHQTVFCASDTALVIPLTNRLQEHFAQEKGYVLKSHSFDRGFYSQLNESYLQKFVEQVVLPKRGYKSAAREAEENNPLFVLLRNKHSAVESSINELEHCGVNRVPDKGAAGFKRYVAYGVLAFNLKRLGAVVIEENLLNTVIDTRTRKMSPHRKRKRAA